MAQFSRYVRARRSVVSGRYLPFCGCAQNSSALAMRPQPSPRPRSLWMSSRVFVDHAALAIGGHLPLEDVPPERDLGPRAQGSRGVADSVLFVVDVTDG